MSRWHCSVKGAQVNFFFLPFFLPTFLHAFLCSFFILPPSPSSSSPLPSSSSLYPSLTQVGSHFSFALCDKFSESQVYFLWILPKAILLYREKHGKERVLKPFLYVGVVWKKLLKAFIWSLPLTRYQVHTYPSYAFHSADLLLVQKPCRFCFIPCFSYACPPRHLVLTCLT